jgi:tetratricopeptide (TPR) repeat protein
MIRALILALCVGGVAVAGSTAAAGSYENALNDYNQTRFDAAVAELAHPADARSWDLLGKARFMQGDYSKATDALEKAVALDPRSSDSQLWLGRAYGRRAETAFALHAFGYAKKSREALERAVELDPANKGALGDLFDFYVEAPGVVGGGVEKARSLLPAIQRADPGQVDFAQARIDEEEKRYGSAESHLRRGVANSPELVGQVLNLARFLARHGRFEESDQEFQLAQKMAPGAPRVIFAQADTLIQTRRNLDEARTLLKKYLAADNLTPSDPSRSEALRLLKKIEGS